MVVVECTNKRR